MKKIIMTIAIAAGLSATAQVKVGANVNTLAPGANFQVEATDATQFYIRKADGNVGIGTTAPDHKLTVLSTTPDLANFFYANGTTNPRLYIKGDANKFTFQTTYSTGGADIAFATAGAPSAMIIKENGNVGVGTTAPAVKLDVVANGRGNDVFSVRENGGVTTGAIIGHFNSGSDPELTLKQTATNSIAYYTTESASNARLMQLGSTFLNGINLSTSSSLQLGIDSNSTGSGDFEIAKGNSFNGRSLTDGTSLFTVRNGGNVGIGTRAPVAKLDLRGNYSQTNASGVTSQYNITDANADQVRANLSFYSNTNSSPDYFGGMGFKFEGGSNNTARQFQIHVSDVVTPKFVINGVGNVGIGTTAPLTRFDIGSLGAATFAPIATIARPATGMDQNFALQTFSGVGSNSTDEITTQLGMSYSGNSLIAGFDFMRGSNGNTGSLAFRTDKTEKMRILGNGNVGVGTNAPLTRLEIKNTNSTWGDFIGYTGETIGSQRPNNKIGDLILSQSISGVAAPGQPNYKGGLTFGEGSGIYSVNPNPDGSPYYGDIRFHVTDWNGTTYRNADKMIINSGGVQIGVAGQTGGSHLNVIGTAWIATTPTITTATKVLVKDSSTNQISEQAVSLGNVPVIVTTVGTPLPGDAFVSPAGGGVIVKSTGGINWKITVSDAGVVTTTKM